MAKTQLIRAEKLEKTVGEFVDLRTNFGQTALARAKNLEGPRVKALLELIKKLKEKGITNLGAPLVFSLKDYQKGDVHERVGVSIASPELRTMYTYSIHAGGVNAGQVEGLGNVGRLGEISVGKILNKELPVLLPVLGDERYSEFFDLPGRQRRNKDVRDTAGELTKRALEELSKTGFDVSDLEGVLRDFFINASVTDTGSDISWLRKQIDSNKIIDGKLQNALVQVSENPEYKPEHAQLVGQAVMELRKKPTSGLIGSLRDDLYYLENHPEAYSSARKIDLDQTFTRRRFYPEKGIVQEGTLRDKLTEPVMSFAEALGVVSAAPGVMDIRKSFNRANAKKYFGEEVQEGVAILNQAISIISKEVKEDDLRYRDAKREKRKPDLFLKRKYGLAKKIEEYRQLESEKGNWGNLVNWIRMEDSEKIFSGAYTLSKQIQFARQSGLDSIMSEDYDNLIDFREKTGINMGDAIKRISAIKIGKARAKKAKLKLTDYEKIQKSIDAIKSEAEFNLVRAGFNDKIAKAYSAVKDFYENTAETKKKVKLLNDLQDACGLNTRFSQKDLEGQYVSPERKSEIDRIYNAAKNSERLGKLDRMGLAQLSEARQAILEHSGKLIYDSGRGGLYQDKPMNMPIEFLGNAGVFFISPDKILARAEELSKYKSVKELGEEFADRVKYVAENVHIRLNRPVIVNLAREIEKTPERVFVSPRVVRGINSEYTNLRKTKNKFS